MCSCFVRERERETIIKQTIGFHKSFTFFSSSVFVHKSSGKINFKQRDRTLTSYNIEVCAPACVSKNTLFVYRAWHLIFVIVFSVSPEILPMVNWGSISTLFYFLHSIFGPIHFCIVCAHSLIYLYILDSCVIIKDRNRCCTDNFFFFY